MVDDQNEKMAALIYLLCEIIPNPQGTLIFVSTRYHAELISVVPSPFSHK